MSQQSPKPERLHTFVLKHASEQMRNLASLWAIPPDELPDGAAQLILVALAYTSHEVYAYEAAAGWYLWLEDLSQSRPGRDGRVSVAEWLAHWPEILAEFYPGEGKEAGE